MHSIRKALVEVILVLLIVAGVQKVTRFCYEDWSSPTIWSKQERKELEGTLDTLYCGTSLTYCAFNTEVLDEALGTESFNLGTASQPYMGTYYLIRETVDYNPVKRIFLTISLPPLLNDDIKTHDYVSPFENMYSWKWKLAYLSAVNDEDVWISSLLYSTQVEHYLALEEVKENLEHKIQIQKAPKSYAGRGYRLFSSVYKGRDREENLRMNTWIGELGASQVQEEGIYYLEKIAEFCKEQGIELIFVEPPYTQDFIDGGGDLDGFHQYILEKAEEWDVEYYDFVLYKDRKTVFTDDKFRDVNHMNSTGAELFSSLLAEVVQSENLQDYFYESLAQFEEE